MQGEHSAILSTFIKLPFVINTFVLSTLSGHLRQVLLYNTIANLPVINKLTYLIMRNLYFLHAG